MMERVLGKLPQPMAKACKNDVAKLFNSRWVAGKTLRVGCTIN